MIRLLIWIAIATYSMGCSGKTSSSGVGIPKIEKLPPEVERSPEEAMKQSKETKKRLR